MRDTDRNDCLMDAITIYAKTGNIALTYRILIEKGYYFCEGTLRNWYKRHKRDFEKARSEFIDRLTTYSARRATFLDEELENLRDFKRRLQDKIKETMNSKDVKLQQLSQCTHGLNKLAAQIVSIYDRLEKKNFEDSQVVKAIRKVLFRHKTVGPVVKEHWDSIKAAVLKEVRKKK